VATGRVTLRLTEPIGTIEKNIKRAIATELNSRVRTRRARLLGKMKRAVESWVSSSRFIRDLGNGGIGSIAAELGITAGNESIVVNSITSAIVESTVLDVTKFTTTLQGGIQIRFQPSNFINLLSLPDGFTVTEKGDQLHWMDWLINKGDQVIIFDYTFTPGLEGRSGGGVMLGGGSYRVNPFYSGTADSNVFTDIFRNREQTIADIVEQEIFG